MIEIKREDDGIEFLFAREARECYGCIGKNTFSPAAISPVCGAVFAAGALIIGVRPRRGERRAQRGGAKRSQLACAFDLRGNRFCRHPIIEVCYIVNWEAA